MAVHKNITAIISNPNKSIESCYQKRKSSIVMLTLFVSIWGVFFTLAAAKWVKDAEEGKVSPKNISSVFFYSALLLLFIGFLGWRTDYFKLEICIIFYMTMASIFLITSIDAKKASSHALT